MSDSSSTPGAAPPPENTPDSVSGSPPNNLAESNPKTSLEQVSEDARNPTLERTPGFATVEKALYELGFSYHMFPFWAEKSWFEVREFPCDRTRYHHGYLVATVDYLAAQDAVDDEGIERLTKFQEVANLCWKNLREKFPSPQRCSHASQIEELEPEFLTDDLWTENTVLRHSEWKKYEIAFAPLLATLKQSLSLLVETGALVAQTQTDGYGVSFTRRDRHPPVTELHYALLKLRENFPDWDDVDLDVSESRLTAMAASLQLSLEQVGSRRAEAIHATLLDRLSAAAVKERQMPRLNQIAPRRVKQSGQRPRSASRFLTQTPPTPPPENPTRTPPIPPETATTNSSHQGDDSGPAGSKKRDAQEQSKKKTPQRDSDKYRWALAVVREIMQKKPGATRQLIQRELKRLHGKGIANGTLTMILSDLRNEHLYKRKERASSKDKL